MRAIVLILSACLAAPALAQEDGYITFVKRVQVALHLHGFDPGPVNGRDDGATQAAIARFQLSRNLPASGSMDDSTLKELGVSRETAELEPEEENASAGAGMPLAKP